MKKKIKAALVFVALILLYSPGYPGSAANAPTATSPTHKDDTVTFECISLEHGLSQISINAITQDAKGFMWFGTQDGLNKYDGYDFTIYRHDSSNPKSLSDSHIRYLYTDKTGTLWVCTYSRGLNQLDQDTGTFIHYLHDPNDPGSISHDEISVIYEDRGGTLWVGTGGGGLNQLDRETGRFTHYRHSPTNPYSLSSDIIKAICEDGEGYLWIGTKGGGLNKFDRTTGMFTRYSSEPGNPCSLKHNDVTCIYETSKGVLWVGTEGGGLHRLDRGKKCFINYVHQPGNPAGLSHNIINVINEDRKGRLWIGTFGGGLNIFDPEKETFTSYKHHDETPGTLSHNRVMSIYKDNTGILWIGTYRGIDKYDPERLRFYHIKRSPNDPNSLNDEDIRAIYQDKDGILWIGTYSGGLHQFDPKTGKMIHYSHDPLNPNSLSNNRVFTILEDNAGILWLGSRGGGLTAFDREKGTFTHYRYDPHDPDSLSNDKVRTIYQDSTGRLWIATMGGGLNRFNRKQNTFSHYLYNATDPFSISSDRVFPIQEDKSGILWLGTFGGGLNRFDPEEETFTHYRHNIADPNSPSSDRVFSIHIPEHSEHMLWIGTDGGGLNRFDRKKGQWKRFSKKHGLPSNVIYGILEDHRRNLWLSTTKGLSKYNPYTQTFRNYTAEDGLQNIEFNSGAYYKNPVTGEMFFGGLNGLNSFFPDTIKPNPYINPVVITAFKKMNRLVTFNKAIDELEEIKLTHKDSFFSFEFVTPEYRSPDKIQYAYKLEGFNNHWVSSGTRRYANYTSIPGGKYTFRVKSRNQDGAESESSVRVWVIPPFWETWWFFAVLLVLVLILTFAVIQFRTYTIRRRNRELQAINLQLNQQIKERHQAEMLQAALYKIAKITHSDTAFDEIYRSIHQAIGQLIDASNFYIALYDHVEHTIFLPYFIDEKDNYMGRTFKPFKGLTEYVIRTNKSLLAGEADINELVEKGEVNRFGTDAKIWLGVPLRFKNEIFGTVVVQHYSDPHAYTEKDKQMLEFVSDQIAGVIHRKREEEEKNALKEKLALSEKMEAIGRLAGGVAHDLNNVLSAIVSYPELLLLKLPQDSPLRKPLLTMKRSGQRAAAIVQDLLTLARRGVDVKEVVNWNDIIREYLRSPVFENLKAAHPGVKVEVKLADDLLNIEGSPVHLTKALMNLCSNAVEAMPHGGTLTIISRNLYQDKVFEDYGIYNYVIVMVMDTGVGIAREDLKRIFEPFYTKKAMGFSGTGLGMAIVWNTVNDHNGFLNVNSEVEKGALFELYFPVTHAVASRKSKTVGIEEFKGKGEHILVIDDVPEQREILTVLLTELGYRAESVASGEEAVAYMKKHTEDVTLLVLDMIMEGGMDGLDTYIEILKIKPGIKAVIASGFSETDRVREAVRLGAGAYIKKPYTLEKIGMALKKELEKETAKDTKDTKKN